MAGDLDDDDAGAMVRVAPLEGGGFRVFALVDGTCVYHEDVRNDQMIGALLNAVQAVLNQLGHSVHDRIAEVVRLLGAIDSAH